LLAASAAACGDDGEEAVAPTPTATAQAFPLTIEQSDGEVLTLDAPPQRIVSLSAHATDILCTIGAGDQLVAVELYANCPEGTKEKPELDAFQPNAEAIAGYEPDLVYVSSNTSDIVTTLRDAGIPVLYLELPTSLDGAMEQILLFGRITGRTQEAEQVVADIRAQIEQIEQELADVETGPRVFHELDPTFFTASPDTFIGEYYERLKAQNIAAGATDLYPQLSAEAIVQADPEVIVLADEEAGVTPEAVKQRPGWDVISAVRNDRICVVDPDLVSQPGPDIGEAMETLAECLYPDRF
jgi:iron complex transport system substrate-binding protein